MSFLRLGFCILRRLLCWIADLTCNVVQTCCRLPRRLHQVVLVLPTAQHDVLVIPFVRYWAILQWSTCNRHLATRSSSRVAWYQDATTPLWKCASVFEHRGIRRLQGCGWHTSWKLREDGGGRSHGPHDKHGRFWKNIHAVATPLLCRRWHQNAGHADCIMDWYARRRCVRHIRSQLLPRKKIRMKDDTPKPEEYTDCFSEMTLPS